MTTNKFLRHLLPNICLATLAACGGGDGDGDDSGGPAVNVAGRWAITETMGTNNCGEPVGVSFSYALTAAQSGASLTVRTEDARVFNGSIDGRRIEWTGSYADTGGTTTIEDMDVDVSEDGNRLGGSTTWRWTNGRESCSGRTSVNGIRTAVAGSVG